MEDIAELGASSAKDYIRGLEKDIHRLNNTKENTEYENKILKEKINDQENELNRKVASLAMFQVKIDEMAQDIDNKTNYYLNVLNDNAESEEENKKLEENIKLHQEEEIRLRSEVELTKTKLNENIEKLQNNEDEIKKIK